MHTVESTAERGSDARNEKFNSSGREPDIRQSPYDRHTFLHKGRQHARHTSMVGKHRLRSGGVRLLDA